MKKFLIAAVVTLLCMTCQANPLIYKMNLTQTRNGAGNSYVTKYVGFAVIEETEVVFLLADSQSKKYARVYPTEYEAALVTTGTKALSYVIITGNEKLGGFIARGVNSTREPEGALVPRSLTISGAALFTISPSTTWRADEFKGAMAYDAKKTAQYYDMRLSVSGALGLLETELLGKGYLPE